MNNVHSTTILCVRHRGQTVMASDGQVSFDNTIVKHEANKVRVLASGKALAGFAGGAADALALMTRFEEKLQEYHGNFERAVVELAKDWRMDKVLRQLQAMMIVASATHSFIISGSGDIIQPDDGLLAIGSGGPYALAAARALVESTDLDAGAIVEKAMKIAASICIYTNQNIHLETIRDT